MKKKRIIIISLIVLFIIILVPALLIGWRKREIKKNIMRLRNEGYCYILSIEGEFRYTPNTVEVMEMEVDERQLLIDVVLYNEYHKNDKITTEQVLEEYNNFCNNSGTTDGLDALYAFDRADEDDKQEHPLFNYTMGISNYMREKFGVSNINDMTMEQLEEAAEYAAQKWRETLGEY